MELVRLPRGRSSFQGTRPAAQQYALVLEVHLGDVFHGEELEAPAETPDANGEQPWPVSGVKDLLESADVALRRIDPKTLARSEPEVEVRRSGSAEIEVVGSHFERTFLIVLRGPSGTRGERRSTSNDKTAPPRRLPPERVMMRRCD